MTDMKLTPIRRPRMPPNEATKSKKVIWSN